MAVLKVRENKQEFKENLIKKKKKLRRDRRLLTVAKLPDLLHDYKLLFWKFLFLRGE